VEAADGLAKGLTEGGPDPGREVAGVAAAAVLLLGPGPLQQLPRPAGRLAEEVGQTGQGRPVADPTGDRRRHSQDRPAAGQRPVAGLDHHMRAAVRLASGQPATVGLRWVEPGRPPRPVELDLVFRTERGTAVNPNHASRAFARLAASVGLAAHPHLLRHALASGGGKVERILAPSDRAAVTKDTKLR
jgi:hypothetical protein